MYQCIRYDVVTFVVTRRGVGERKTANSLRISGLLWCQRESNQWHKDFQSFALPTELWHHRFFCLLIGHSRVQRCKGRNYFLNWQGVSAKIFQKCRKWKAKQANRGHGKREKEKAKERIGGESKGRQDRRRRIQQGLTTSRWEATTYILATQFYGCTLLHPYISKMNSLIDGRRALQNNQFSLTL